MNRLWIWAIVRLRALAGDERGANFVEYALLVAFAVLLVLVAIRNYSNAFINAVNFVADSISKSVNPS